MVYPLLVGEADSVIKPVISKQFMVGVFYLYCDVHSHVQETSSGSSLAPAHVSICHLLIMYHNGLRDDCAGWL